MSGGWIYSPATETTEQVDPTVLLQNILSELKQIKYGMMLLTNKDLSKGGET